MRVLHILNELKYSGAEIMYVDAAPIFQRLGCELFVVNTYINMGEYASSFKKAGYRVFHKPFVFKKTEIGKRYRWIQDMRKLIRENRIDVVHIHAARLRGVMSFVAWWAGVRSVYTFHNVFKSNSTIGYMKGWLERWIAKNVFNCRFQTISDSVYQNEKNYWKDDTTLIYNWYGKSRFYPRSELDRKEQRTRLGYADNELVIVAVGGCSPVKRHSDVIKALPLMIRKGFKVVYQHLGEGDSLEEEKLLAQELGVADNVRFLGNQRDVRKYLVASDIYVMTSRNEGIPLTTIEAMACKIPCVLYDVPGLCDFNKELDCCHLITESPKVLASAVYELYNNPDEQKRITDNGFLYISKYFDMDKNANKIYELYLSKKGKI